MAAVAAAFGYVEHLFHRHRFTLLWLGFLVAAGVLLYRALVWDSTSYALQDILINNADGMVRRGIGGEAVRALQGLFGGSFRFWAFALLSAVACGLFGASLRLYRRLPDDPMYLPLILAPWGLLFYAYDPDGSFRKEVVGYLAIALILQGALAARVLAMWIWAFAGVAVFLGALFVHEANLFLWPTLVMALWLVGRAWPKAGAALLGIALLAGAAGTAVVWYLINLPQPDPAVICAAVAQQPCSGPFEWLNAGLDAGIAYVAQRRDWDEAVYYAVLAVLGMVPFFAVRLPWGGWRLTALAVAIPFVAVLPLFLIAYDWGRWIQMALFPLSLVFVTAVALGLANYRRLLPPWLAVPYIASLSMPHAGGSIRLEAAYILGALVALVAAEWVFARIAGVLRAR